MNARYQAQINEYLVQLRDSVEQVELKQILQQAIEAGGKRVRPILCLLAYKMFDADYQRALPQAVALELFHTFSLVHDDIMDEAPTRRGHPSIYKSYGRDRAILAGDVILILAYNELLADLNPQLTGEVMACFSKMAVQVCEGQMLDMDFEEDRFPDQEDYMKMIELKTSVLIGAALKIGAIVGGAREKEANALYRYGILQGLAFQIQDDLLDAYGDPQVIGKQPGGDIIQKKKTLLTILCALKSGNDRDKFENYFFDDQMNPEKKIKLILDAYKKYGIKEDVELIKNSLVKEAETILAGLEVENRRKLELIEISNWLMHRNY